METNTLTTIERREARVRSTKLNALVFELKKAINESKDNTEYMNSLARLEGLAKEIGTTIDEVWDIAYPEYAMM